MVCSIVPEIYKIGHDTTVCMQDDIGPAVHSLELYTYWKHIFSFKCLTSPPLLWNVALTLRLKARDAWQQSQPWYSKTIWTEHQGKIVATNDNVMTCTIALPAPDHFSSAWSDDPIWVYMKLKWTKSILLVWNKPHKCALKFCFHWLCDVDG